MNKEDDMVDLEKQSILSNIKMLYIEDDESERIELEKFLRRRLGRMVVAEDGLDGYKLIEKCNPDIIITDLKMPNMTGIELIKKIREEGYDGGVIITSAASDSETILKAIDYNVVKYILKPINTKELMKTIEELALEIVKNKKDKTVLEEKYILNREEKIDLEEEIGRKTAYFLKKNTGKGPRNIRVFIQGNTIEIEALEILTSYELSIVKNIRNSALMDYTREIFYKENGKELEQALKEILNSDVEIKEIKTSSEKNSTNIKISIL